MAMLNNQRVYITMWMRPNDQVGQCKTHCLASKVNHRRVKGTQNMQGGAPQLAKLVHNSNN